MNLSFFNILYFLYILFAPLAKEETVKAPADPYIKNYFSFPLSPGITTSLSGSFGDIRVNHFHAGLDIRTGGIEGKSVYAAAEGYVSRIMVSKGGYGNALYITHPNGLTTLYGHLKEYSAKIKKHLVAEQYKQEKWEIDLYLSPGEIPVKKGELVARSGNTGGSGGPHLHFEIRDQEENTLDPSLFGFKEIKDNVAPVVEFVSLVCLSADARVNGKFGNFDFRVSRNNAGQYFLPQKITVWGDIGIELYTYDKTQNSPFKLGIKSIEVKNDTIETFRYELDKLAFHNKIDMNLHTNYERMVTQNKKLHKLYYEKGNSLDFYNFNQNNGVLSFEDSQMHRINVKLKDSHNNVRSLSFGLQSKQNVTSTSTLLKGGESQKVDLFGSIIRLTRRKTNTELLLFDGNRRTSLSPSYVNTSEETFVFDLEKDFYSKYSFGQNTNPIPVTDEVSPNFNSVVAKEFELDFKNTLYHPIYVNFDSGNGKLSLDKDVIPLSGHFNAKWRTNKTNIDSKKEKVFLTSGKKPIYIGGEWQNNIISFNPKEFGTYEILKDVTKPIIEARNLTANRLLFKISDKLSGIKSFECHINGEWVLMEYEYKNGLLWSERLNDKKLSGEIELKVLDFCGNEAVFRRVI